MATLFESPYLSNRLRQIEERYEEPATFGKCDCTSYSYLALSIVLFAIGTTITILALGDVADGHVFNHLGHMWLVGPIFICSGLMVAVKCMLYLRRKSVIQMIFHQRQLFRQHLQGFGSGQALSSSGSMTPAPPAYVDIIAQSQGPLVIHHHHQSELPPPTYDEAMTLLQQQDGKPCGTATDSNNAPMDMPMPNCKP